MQRGLSAAVPILCCAGQYQRHQQHRRAGLQRVHLICASHCTLAITSAVVRCWAAPSCNRMRRNACGAAFASGVAGVMSEFYCASSDSNTGFASSRRGLSMRAKRCVSTPAVTRTGLRVVAAPACGVAGCRAPAYASSVDSTHELG